MITAENDHNHIKQHTLTWIKSFIIEYNICPFAGHVIKEHLLSMSVSESLTIEDALQDLRTEIIRLNHGPDIETSLIIFPHAFSAFFDYLDYVDCAEHILKQEGYEGIYQLASFHPKYCFANVPEDDVTNYTNRSPYPMIHILRETSIDKAIAFYGDTTKIPEKNIKLMKQLGRTELNSIFNMAAT